MLVHGLHTANPAVAVASTGPFTSPHRECPPTPAIDTPIARPMGMATSGRVEPATKTGTFMWGVNDIGDDNGGRGSESNGVFRGAGNEVITDGGHVGGSGGGFTDNESCRSQNNNASYGGGNGNGEGCGTRGSGGRG